MHPGKWSPRMVLSVKWTAFNTKISKRRFKLSSNYVVFKYGRLQFVFALLRSVLFIYTYLVSYLESISYFHIVLPHFCVIFLYLLKYYTVASVHCKWFSHKLTFVVLYSTCIFILAAFWLSCYVFMLMLLYSCVQPDFQQLNSPAQFWFSEKK